jgi:hypothetical protein
MSIQASNFSATDDRNYNNKKQEHKIRRGREGR